MHANGDAASRATCTQFLSFLVYHLWCYDRFKCLHWSSGRQPGAFKRVMTVRFYLSFRGRAGLVIGDAVLVSRSGTAVNGV